MKIKHSKSYYVYQVFNTIILTLVTLSCIFPILHVFAMSLSDSTAAMAGRVTFFPVDFSLAAYEYLIKKKDFFHSVAISGGRVVIGTAFNMILIVLTAYPLARPTSQFRGRTAYMIYFAITMFLGGGPDPDLHGHQEPASSEYFLGTGSALRHEYLERYHYDELYQGLTEVR